MGQPGVSPAGLVSRQTVAQIEYSLWRTTGFDFQPPQVDRSPRAPQGETVLGRDRSDLVCRLNQGCVVPDRENNMVPLAELTAKEGGWTSDRASAIAALVQTNACSGKPRQKRTIPNSACDITWG